MAVEIGARGFRVLDDQRFACVVVDVIPGAHNAMPLLSVRFDDDGAREDGVEVDEFEAMMADPPLDVMAPDGDPASPFDPLTTLTVVKNPKSSAVDEVDVVEDVLLDLVAGFLDHVEWMRSLVLVNRSWRRRLLTQPRHWLHVCIPSFIAYRGGDRDCPVPISMQWPRVSSLFEVVLHVEPAICVSTVVEFLVLDDCNVSDGQVLSLVHRCQGIRSLSLRRCPRVTFMLLYDLLRLRRERQPPTNNGDDQRGLLRHLDIWGCPGISPSFVLQLQASGEKARPHRRMQISGPGFYFLDPPQYATHTSVLEVLATYKTTSTAPELLSLPSSPGIVWCDKARFLSVLADEKNGASGESTSDRLAGWRRYKPILHAFPLSIVPVVPVMAILKRPGLSGEGPTHQFAIPATLEDLERLARNLGLAIGDHYVARLQSQFGNALDVSYSEASVGKNPSHCASDVDSGDSLEARAERVFAQLRQTTEDLQRQVRQLEEQVVRLTAAKDNAEREYRQAERELGRVAREADRALLHLATSSDPQSIDQSLPPPPPPPPPSTSSEDVIAVSQDGDIDLPPLPDATIQQRAARELERQYFSVIDGFAGPSLSKQVRDDVEKLYRESRIEAHSENANGPVPSAPTPSEQEEKNPTVARFRLGELAGGNTGRNLRYQMAHVRGDFVLWVGEDDPWCPTSIRKTLRQLDRLVLDRLGQLNHELSMSALMRKKAMITCYPGRNRARYTRHCDNPNKNGRKLTAILYLNTEWRPDHGGALSIRTSAQSTVIEPLMDRLLLFFSDSRVPHEVRPCAQVNRFALTVWYLDYDEFMNAQVFGNLTQEPRAEKARIEKEISGFTQSREDAAVQSMAA